MSTAMVLVAIEQANWTDQRNGLYDVKDIVHHTDRGSQYSVIHAGDRDWRSSPRSFARASSRILGPCSPRPRTSTIDISEAAVLAKLVLS